MSPSPPAVTRFGTRQWMVVDAVVAAGMLVALVAFIMLGHRHHPHPASGHDPASLTPVPGISSVGGLVKQVTEAGPAGLAAR